MSEGFVCMEPGCRDTDRHVHRQCWYDIHHNLHWYELQRGDVEMLKEARAAQGLPRLVFTLAEEAEDLVFEPDEEHGGRVRPAAPPDTSE